MKFHAICVILWISLHLILFVRCLDFYQYFYAQSLLFAAYQTSVHSNVVIDKSDSIFYLHKKITAMTDDKFAMYYY